MNSMQALLRTTFERYATRPALQGRDLALNYAELDAATAALALALRERGVGPGTIVPLLVARSALLVIAEVALLRLGAAYAPIDLASPIARQRAMLAAIDGTLVLTDGAHGDDAAADGTTRFDLAAWLSGRPVGSAASGERPWIAPPADSPVYVMFTSGSTGVPKGVMVPHAGIVRLVRDGDYAHFGPEQRWGFVSSPAFDLSTLEVWGALLNGGCCVVQEEALPSLDMLGEFLLGQRVTDTWLTSALFNAMVEDQLPSLGRLRQLLVGGERVSARHARMMLEAHPSVRLIDGYGPTENTTFTLCHTITLPDTEGEAGVPIGVPLSGTQVRIEPLDPQTPERGELWTAGDGVALGYLGDAELTAAKFVWLDGRRWYRTGDLVRERPDGVFEFHGRIDRQIKLRGQRIELEEVELALTRCPGVGNGAVLVTGEQAEQRRIVAVYNLLDATGPSADQIAAQMRETLPDAAIPSEFIQLPQLPANLNGKVDRQALAQMLAQRSAPHGPGAGPETPLSLRLRSITQRYPHRLAVEGEHEKFSYGELERRTLCLAAHLAEAGVRSGSRVALFVPRSPGLIVAMLACLHLGATYAPIDLASPPGRIDRMLAVLQPHASVIGVAIDRQLPVPQVDLQRIDWQAEHRAPPAAEPFGGEVPTCIFFTSGSTGMPRAVMVPASGIERLVRDDAHAHFGMEQRWAFMSSPAFDAATLEVWAPLLNGGTCVVQELEDPSLADLARFLVEWRITDVWMTSGLFSAMVQEQLPALGGLRQLLAGGERVAAGHAARLLTAHPETRLINGYGPTENTTFTLCRTVTLADTESPAGLPIGSPVPDTCVRVEPGDAGDPRTGELWTAGAGVALGYFGDAAATRERFVEQQGVRWYRTGDWVREREDGVFEFLGRRDRQVKLQGHRVEMDEVEQALGACAGVGQAVILLRGSDSATAHLAACFSAATDAKPTVEAIAEALAAQLPAAAMPKAFHFLPTMPVTLNGKVDRAALSDLLDAEALQAEAASGDGDFEALGADETGTERDLTAIWRSLLPQVPLDAASHFLRVGGTSLLALHVAALVHKRLHKLISPVDVLRHPILAEQARWIAQAAPAAAQSEPSPTDWNVPLSRAQRNVLAATRLDPTGCAYLVHVALCVPAAVPPARWQAAFESLARRHPALRLQAAHDGFGARARLRTSLAPGWWQLHAPLASAPSDLDWPADLLEQINRPLDTAELGSMRVDCWPVRDDELLLVWTVHHHVIDEASIDLGLKELDALLAGRSLPPVYGSPFGFAAIETAWTDAAADQAWADRLVDALSGHPAPLPHPPAHGRERSMAWAPELQRRLAACCRALGCTPFPVVLTAYGLALQDLFGDPFRFVSTPFSRRAEPELVEPIGYLLDVRMIEAGALPAESAAQTLSRVVDAVHAAQKPAFQSLDDLIAATAARDPQVAQTLTQFGLTWRIDPAGPLPMAVGQARKMRPPQIGARYGLCLHLAQLGDRLGASIEAPDAVHESGTVDRLWTAFVARLEALCAMRSLGAPDPQHARADQAARSTPAAPGPHNQVLRDSWARWLGVAIQDIGPESHFLRSGGSSLVAMRMAAGLRREHGLNIDLGAFLADARFARLDALARGSAPPRPEGYVLLGPADAARVMVVLPGAGGQTAGMFALGDELLRRLGPGTAVALVDIDAALELAPADEPLWFVSHRIVQILRDLGRERLMGIVGFSMGGTLALKVVVALGPGRPIPVWMLDTFAPRTHRYTLMRKVERRLAWKFYGNRPANSHSSSSSASSLQALPLRSTPSQWALLGQQLDRENVSAPGCDVQLIQARQSVKDAGVVWQRRNNGFDPRAFGSWQVHEIEGAHLDIPRHLAAGTAEIIVGNGKFGAGAV